MSVNDHTTKFFLAHFSDAPEDSLNFELAIPKVCQMLPYDAHVGMLREPFVPLVSFRSREAPPLEIDVRMTVLPREIDAGDFAELSTITGGGKVVQRRDWDNTQGCQAEVIASRDRSGETWLCRTRVVKDGRRLYRVDAASPESVFADLAEECAVPVMSFRLLNPENKISVEDLEVWSVSSGPVASFRYPAAWQPRRVDHDDRHVEIILENFAGKCLDGTVTVEFHRPSQDTPLPSYFRTFADRMKQQGLRLSGAAITSSRPTAGLRALIYAPRAFKEGRSWCVGASCSNRPMAWFW